MDVWCFFHSCHNFHTGTMNKTVFRMEFVKLVWGNESYFKQASLDFLTTAVWEKKTETVKKKNRYIWYISFNLHVVLLLPKCSSFWKHHLSSFKVARSFGYFRPLKGPKSWHGVIKLISKNYWQLANRWLTVSLTKWSLLLPIMLLFH